MPERHGIDPCLLCLYLPLSALYLRFICGPSAAHLAAYQRMRKPRRVVNGARMFAGRW
jgi:hypothetical protein